MHAQMVIIMMPCCPPLPPPAPSPQPHWVGNRMGTRLGTGLTTLVSNTFTVPCTARGTTFLRVRSAIAGATPYRGTNYFANIDATCAAAACE